LNACDKEGFQLFDSNAGLRNIYLFVFVKPIWLDEAVEVHEVEIFEEGGLLLGEVEDELQTDFAGEHQVEIVGVLFPAVLDDDVGLVELNNGFQKLLVFFALFDLELRLLLG